MLMKMSSLGSHAEPELPAVDERLVAPESGYEIDDGKLIRVCPSDEPHGTRHAKLLALLEAHLGEDFDAAADMLTRISATGDIAPDASVFPRARDPRTGGRQIEHLAFEVASTESLGHAGDRAAKLAARGVRRVFALDVRRGRAFEWSRELGTWCLLAPQARIEDPALAVPIPVEALVVAAKADDAMASALLAKGNPVLVGAMAASRERGHQEGRAEGMEEGRRLGRVESILDMLALRNLHPTAAQRARILEEHDHAVLERWFARAVTCSTIEELFASP
jgi:Uma2 family endonuclease